MSLGRLPYFGGETLPAHVRYLNGVESAFLHSQKQNHAQVQEYAANVDPKLVVCAPSFKDWSDSYKRAHDEALHRSGWNAVMEWAQKFDRMFSDELFFDSERELDQYIEEKFLSVWQALPITLDEFMGPNGPMYFLQEGSHRMAACKLVGLESVPVRVRSVSPSQSEKVWDEALIKMDEDVRKEFLRVYQLLYPDFLPRLTEEQLQLKRALEGLSQIGPLS